MTSSGLARSLVQPRADRGPDDIGYSAAISARATLRKREQVLGALLEMWRSQLQPKLSDASRPSALARSSAAGAGLGLVAWIRRSLLQPDVIGCNAATSACEKLRRRGAGPRLDA